MCYADEQASAILQAWYPGARGGRAVSDILFGKTSPSGKLPITFYRNSEDLGDFEDYNMKGKTYRFVENEDNVLYPFGFGLTYGKTKVKSAELKKDGENLIVKAIVENLGEHEIEDVVQVYIQSTEPLEKSNPKLCGFKRVKIKDKKEIKIKLDKQCLESVSNDGERKVRGSSYKIFVGILQPDKRSIELLKQKPLEIEFNI